MLPLLQLEILVKGWVVRMSWGSRESLKLHGLDRLASPLSSHAKDLRLSDEKRSRG